MKLLLSSMLSVNNPASVLQRFRNSAGRCYHRFWLFWRLPIWTLRKDHINFTATIEKDAWINRSKIGQYAYIGPRTNIDVATIGNYSCISGGVAIGGMNHAYDKSYSISPLLNDFCIYDKRTVVGNDVWIGSRAIVLQGVTIGDGAVIGAGSVVTHDIPENSIAFGSPARVYKKRYSDEVWERIKETQYWNLSPQKARERMQMIDLEIRKTVEDSE